MIKPLTCYRMKILFPKSTCGLAIIAFYLLGTMQLTHAQQGVSLRWIPNWDWDNEILNATIQVKADVPGEEMIGTSSIYMNYNTQALIFNDYSSLNFHERNLCVGGRVSA